MKKVSNFALVVYKISLLGGFTDELASPSYAGINTFLIRY